MPKFRTGGDLIKQKAEGKNARGPRATDFTPFFSLKGGEEVFLQFFTDIEDVVLASLHRFVQVRYLDADDKVQGPVYRDFLCHKMDGWDGDGTCVLCDELGHEPKENFAAIAVLLDPVYDPKAKTTRISDITSFKVRGNEFERQDGTKAFFPEVVVVFQASQNFWLAFQSHDAQVGPITAHPWKVIREGNDTGTVYHGFEVDKAEVPDYTDMNVPTISQVLESLGSSERFEVYLGDPELWVEQKQRFTKKDKDNEAPRKKSHDDEGAGTEEDAETAIERIKRMAAARDKSK